MPWNPFKSKKGKADKAGQPIKTGFHPIDLDALGKEDQGGSGDRKAGSGGGESGTADAARADPNAPPQAIAESPRSSASAEEEPLLAAYPEYGRDGLLSAAFTGNATVAKLMLELGPEAKLHKYDALGNTPLHLAAFSGHASVVQVLLDTASAWHDLSPALSSCEAGSKPVKVDVEAKNGEDDTPLYMAVLCNSLDLVKLLANACNRHVNLSNVEGFSPLHYAAGEGNLAISQYLVAECLADTEAQDKLGLTPAFCAVLQGRVEVAEYLLKRSPQSITAVNSSNDTMLHCAIKGMEAEPETMVHLVQLLLSLGASVDVRGSGPNKATARELIAALPQAHLFSLPPPDHSVITPEGEADGGGGAEGVVGNGGGVGTGG